MRDPRKTEPLTVDDLGGESREGFQTGQLGARLGRYGKAKADTLQFANFMRDRAAFLRDGELGHLARQVQSCGSWLAFREYYTVGQTRLIGICSCQKHLLCSVCALRRGGRAVRLYLARVEALMAANPALKPYMVTLTVKNGPNLLERFKHLSSSLRAYHRRRSRERQHGEVLKASSAVWSYEFTNRGKGWHPHVHCIWLCEDAPDQSALSEEWRDITQDSFVVDVRPLDMTDPAGAFCEVFKYAVKFAELSNVDRLEAYRTLRGRRLLDSFGELRGLDVEPGESDELLEDLPFIDRLFKYVTGNGYMEILSSRHAA